MLQQAWYAYSTATFCIAGAACCVHLQVKVFGLTDYSVVSYTLLGGDALSDVQKVQAGMAASDAFGVTVQSIQQAAGLCLTPI